MLLVNDMFHSFGKQHIHSVDNHTYLRLSFKIFMIKKYNHKFRWSLLLENSEAFRNFSDKVGQ